MYGHPQVPFTELVRDTIRVHGLAWAVREYARFLSPFELRFFLKQAYL